MKNKILFVNGGVKEFGNRFKAACEKNNIDCFPVRTHNNSLIIAETGGCRFFHLGEEINLKDFEYCFIRVKGKKSHMTSIFSYLIKSHGIVYNDYNNIEHTQSDEKITQMVKFAQNNIPIPKSLIFSAISYKKNKKIISEHITYPCVVKTNGSKGNAVWKIKDEQELESKIKEISQELILAQELIPNSYDIRALIFDDKLLGAIERISSDGFYNNVAKGGKTRIATLSPEELELSNKGMKVLELNFGGVDFVRTEKGIIFFEINKGPQVYGLENETGLDIPALLVENIKENYLK